MKPIINSSLIILLISASLSACVPQATNGTTPPTGTPTAFPSLSPTASASPQPMPTLNPEPTAQPTAQATASNPATQPTSPVATTSPSSAPSASVTPASSATPVTNSSIPKPTDLLVVSRSKDNLILQWTIPPLNQASSFTMSLDGKQVAEGITTNNYTFTNLAANTTYTLEIQTVVGSQRSEKASVSGTTTNQGTTAIGAFSGGGGGGGIPPAPTATPVPTPTPVMFVQMERLARPAINEGLIFTNDLLNLWNAVPPSVDLTPAAQPIAAEATAVLMALGNNQTQVNALFTALLPDVMRIDINRVSGYVTSRGGAPLDNVTAQLRPVGGRRIVDDVVDITLQLIVPNGAPGGAAIANVESDNVTYAGPNAGGTGHKPVLATFPYLPAPN